MAGKLVALVTYDNVPLAEIARLQLEQEGIPVHLENAEMVSALWHFGNAVGYVRLLVPEEHAERAIALLEVDHATLRDGGQEESTTSDVDVCLSCGAPMSDDQARCSACGWSYSESAEASPPDEPGAVAVPAPAPGNVRRPPKSVSHVQGWRRIAIQFWVSLIVGMFLFGLLGCLLTMFR